MLINLAKNELGYVSRKDLETIIANVANTMKVNQQQNTTTATDWFKLLPEKDKLFFIKFDIVEFYPSISEELLNRSISFASINDSLINITNYSRKYLLFEKTSTWVNKENNSLFDITMRFYGRTKVHEVVGLLFLNRLCTVIEKIIAGL